MSYKSFNEYLIESSKEATFTFGRFNPPTIGHEKLIDSVKKLSRGGVYRIYASKSQDAKKNPLDFKTKVKFLRKMFPKHARSIMSDADVRNVLDIAVKLYDQGFTKIKMVAGSDRIKEFDILLNKYNGVKSRHGYYNFEGAISVVSAGSRDPDADGAKGMSASKMRDAAAKGDLQTFSDGVPEIPGDSQLPLYYAVRKGMGLKKESFRKHIELPPVSEAREDYIEGSLFNKGDRVKIKNSGIVGDIIVCGSNYVIVEEKESSTRKRCWLDAVELYEEHGAGDFGTSKLTKKYSKETPGQDVKENAPANFMRLASAGWTKMAKDFSRFDKGIAKLAQKASQLARKGNDTFQKWFKSLPYEDRLVLAGEIAHYTKQKDKTVEKMLDFKFEGVQEKKKEGKKTQKQDPDIKDRPGSQPAGYFAKDADGDEMAKSTKQARARHFEKGAKKDDDDPSAYKPAPGDARAKTKPSKHTQKFKQMYGENMLSFEDYNVQEQDTDAAIRKKADKSGMPFGILKQVFNRGVAAWRTGHRPGTTSVQWGLARVNSFVTKSDGTWGKADKDLAAKVRGS